MGHNGSDPAADYSIAIKRIPRNIEAEAAFLGACLLENKLAELAVGKLQPDHFYEPLHGRIWKAMCRIMENGKTFTPITLKPIFEADPAMTELGGTGYLMKLAADPAALVGSTEFVDQIIELHRRREIIKAVEIAILDLVEGEERTGDYVQTDDVVNHLDAKLWDQAEATRPRPLGSSAAVARVIERQHRITESGYVEGCESLFVPDLTKITGPLTGGHLTILGARPSVGKTAVALSVASGLAANGHPVSYFHNEMTPDDISMRHVADLSFSMGQRIKLQDIRYGKLTEDGLRWLEKVEERAQAMPLRFHDIAGKDISYVRALVRREVNYWAKQGRKLKVVVFDYLQKMRALDRDGREIENDQQKVKKISRILCEIAAEFDLHVIALCQLGRQVDSRPDRKPLISDLKESGDLEQDADNVILLWRPEIHLADQEPPKSEIEGSKEKRAYEDWLVEMETWREKIEFIGGKVRHGAPRSRRCRFYGENSAVRGSTFDPYLHEGDLFAGADDGDLDDFGGRNWQTN